VADHPCTNRVEDDIACQFQQVGVPLQKDRLVTTLENVADATVYLVDPLRVDAVQLACPLGEIGIQRLNEQVIMVAHQAVGVHQPVEPTTDTPKHIKEGMAVPIAEVNVLFPVTTRGDVVQGTSEFERKWSCRKASLDESRKKE
jgi:hypothetical protein